MVGTLLRARDPLGAILGGEGGTLYNIANLLDIGDDCFVNDKLLD